MGLRFRICNWICGDYLRNYLAIGVLLPLTNLIKYKKAYDINDDTRKKLERIVACVEEIFEL